GDFACHDPANGAVSLGNSVSDTTTGDPNEDTIGGTGRLEGGGGCAAGGGNVGLFVLALLGLLRKRRAR
ncbi:MAG TPA: MYXO-CTERM sorting domain-containing protein, partial [Kofleriaceae bacterium]